MYGNLNVGFLTDVKSITAMTVDTISEHNANPQFMERSRFFHREAACGRGNLVQKPTFLRLPRRVALAMTYGLCA